MPSPAFQSFKKPKFRDWTKEKVFIAPTIDPEVRAELVEVGGIA